MMWAEFLDILISYLVFNFYIERTNSNIRENGGVHTCGYYHILDFGIYAPTNSG
jgi:hypothetical protein